MNTTITATEFRASLAAVAKKVQRGVRFTVLYRGRPAFQVLPLDAVPGLVDDLDNDSLYHAKPVVHSTDGGQAADHDIYLYRKSHLPSPRPSHMGPE